MFIGQFTDIQDENRMKNLENVTIKSLMPYKEALKYVVYADVLLLYGNQNSTQVPGKVYEYLGSRAAVLTVLGDEKDELKDLMEQVNKGPIVLNNEKDIFDAIKSLERRESSNQLSWSQKVAEYKWINVVKDLEKRYLTN